MPVHNVALSPLTRCCCRETPDEDILLRGWLCLLQEVWPLFWTTESEGAAEWCSHCGWLQSAFSITTGLIFSHRVAHFPCRICSSHGLQNAWPACCSGPEDKFVCARMTAVSSSQPARERQHQPLLLHSPQTLHTCVSLLKKRVPPPHHHHPHTSISLSLANHQIITY